MKREIEVAEIDFGGGRHGIVPVGSILTDAAKRMGVSFEGCEPDGHNCEFVVENGAEFLSAMETEEKQQLADKGRSSKNRLGCYTQILRPGVIAVMEKKESEAKNKNEQKQTRDENYRKEFVELPLEKKIANLIHLEAITISETLAYVINSPFTVLDKIGDVLAEFGFKKEEAEKKATRPRSASASTRSKSGGSASKKQPSAEA